MAVDELDDKVQKLKDRMAAALQPYQTFMLQELHFRVIDLTEDYRSTIVSSAEDEKRFQEVKTTLVEIQQLRQVIHEERLGYKQAAVEQKQQQTEATAAIRGDISDLKTELQSSQARSANASSRPTRYIAASPAPAHGTRTLCSRRRATRTRR